MFNFLKKKTPKRKLSYRAITDSKGNLRIGPVYTSMLDFGPGDVFEIKVSESGFELVHLGKCWDTSNMEYQRSLMAED